MENINEKKLIEHIEEMIESLRSIYSGMSLTNRFYVSEDKNSQKYVKIRLDLEFWQSTKDAKIYIDDEEYTSEELVNFLNNCKF